MRFLFAHPRYTKGPYFLGAIKGFDALCAALQRRGHATRVVSYATPGHLRELGFPGPAPEAGAECVTARGPSPVHATLVPEDFFARIKVRHEGGERREEHSPPTGGAASGADLSALLLAHEELLGQQVAEFQPDWVVVDHDLTPRMLEPALRTAPGRVVVMVQNPHALPCGPLAPIPEADPGPLGAARVVVASEFVRRYVAEHCGLESIVQPYLTWEPPFPDLGCFERATAMMINPCDFKGSAIFAGLCESFPAARFVAVRTWGPIDPRLERLDNVRIVEAAPSMNEVLRQASVLLVPSLWAEAFGMVAVDAMLRGIPVIASNIGGLPEASLGEADLVDVRPMTLAGGRAGLAGRIVPEQDLSPWRQALQPLLVDRAHYLARSRASRAAALDYVSGLGVEPLIRGLSQSPDLPSTSWK